MSEARWQKLTVFAWGMLAGYALAVLLVALPSREAQVPAPEPDPCCSAPPETDAADEPTPLGAFAGDSTAIPGTAKEWFTVQSQRALPICAATAIGAAMENVWWQQSGERVRLSSQSIWIAGKRANPACGCRIGCHQYSCVFGVSQWGARLSTEWPQPWLCRDRVPPEDDAIWTTGRRFRISKHRNVSTYSEVIGVIDNGGAVITSVDINASLRARVVDYYEPGGLPHAWALMCAVNMRDAMGRSYIWGVDPQGNDRSRDVSPSSVQTMLDLDGYGIAIEAVEELP